MKFTVSMVVTLAAFASATRLCDDLIRVKSDLTSLATTISNTPLSRAALNSAYMSLTDASDILDKLNAQITQDTSRISTASSSLGNLDINTGCWLGWLTDLESGLQLVSSDLRSIYQKGGHDFQEGNTKDVEGKGSDLASQAQDALSKLTSAQLTLSKYNRDVLCWPA